MKELNGLKFKMIFDPFIKFYSNPFDHKKLITINQNEVIETVGIWENPSNKSNEWKSLVICQNSKGEEFLVPPNYYVNGNENGVLKKLQIQVGDRLGDDLEFVITSIDNEKITAESKSKSKKMHIEANKLNQILVWEMKEDKTFGNVYYPVVYLEDAYYFEVAMLLMERLKEVKQ